MERNMSLIIIKNNVRRLIGSSGSSNLLCNRREWTLLVLARQASMLELLFAKTANMCIDVCLYMIKILN